MAAPVVAEGLRGGVLVGLAAIILGVLGLSPSLTWIPEVPLLIAFVLIPAAIIGVTGWRVGRRPGSVRAGVLAGAMAGAMGGCVGGLTYVAFGKPAVNILAGLIAGLLGGGVVGAVGALLGVRRPSHPNPLPGGRGTS